MIDYIVLGVVAGIFHGTWEYLHLPLYTGYESLGSGWHLVVYATAGDIAYTLLIACVLAAQKRRIDWIRAAERRDYATAATLGFFVALFVEYKALYLHRWSYAASMPMVPLLGVGLSPLLQMTILTPLAIWIARVALRSRWNTGEPAGVE